MKKQTLIIIILAILLIITISYLIIDKYQETRQEKQIEIYQQGAQYGYQQAILQIAQQAVTCQPVPLGIGNNQTINLIAVGCLQQG